MDKAVVDSVAELYEKKAAVIEQIMKLRHDQARIKTEIAKTAVKAKDFSLIANQPRCW